MIIGLVGSIFKVPRCFKKGAQTIGLALGVPKMARFMANGQA